MERVTYYEDDDIKVYLENMSDNVVIHVAIYNMSKAVLRKIRAKWGEVVQLAYYDGYENLFAYTKDPRIINLIGGAEKIGTADGQEVYRWDLS